MKKMKTLMSVSLASLFALNTAWASTAGEIDFADLSEHYGDPKVEINLTADLMQLVGSFANHEDPEVGEMLSKLDHVKVRIYDLEDKFDVANSVLESESKRLKAADWNTLVTVNDFEDEQNVRIFSKASAGVIDGFVVMVVSPEKESGEAIFINIVGEIDPQQIAKLTDNLNIDIN